MGFCVVAPCMCEKCGLINDYCQFYARVERSSLHKLAKAGALSYEDEKYFYLSGCCGRISYSRNLKVFTKAGVRILQMWCSLCLG